MKKLLIILTVLAIVSCKTEKKGYDEAYYQQVETDFNEVKKLTENRADALYSVFNQTLSDDESRYLKFLYAYMPLSDLADLNGDYFIAQVRTALEARSHFSWGETIPDDIFRHFVLPYRVNNEYPDTARQVFYHELKPRIEKLSMHDAAIEVNHWCHEKVNYKGTDERTISPLDAIRSGFGRCGEESTFAVTALRSVGIPARQVYTPRWAHCDDNHAWVEVWVDGKWYFMGACEPEAELNRGWFEAPAKRAMLVHTRVFGKCNETQNQMESNSKYSIINVIDTYIEPVAYVVSVTDALRKPVENAEIKFGLYNYAEFYPIASLKTNAQGVCKLNTNHGTLIISAKKDDQWAYGEFRIGEDRKTDTLHLQLASFVANEYEENLNIEVPKESAATTHNDDNSQNQCRLKNEDSLRNAYAAIFPDDKLIFVFAETRDLNSITVGNHIKMSCGNYDEIMDFIDKAATIDKDKCMQMLELLNEKDHRDARSNVLLDHFTHTSNYGYPNDIYNNYVMNPRISTEKMKPYRSFLQNEFNSSFIDSCRNNPILLVNYVKSNIQNDDEWNYYGLAITPIGVHEMKIADKRSRNIYFVAVCRSMGIAARLNPVTYMSEYYFDNQWVSATFETELSAQKISKGNLTISNSNKELKYYSDFTIARYENGNFSSLDYGWDTPLSQLNMPLQLDAGYYAIMSGKRLPNGDVLVWRQFFNIVPNENKKINLIIRQPNDNQTIIGKIEPFEAIKQSLTSDYYLFIWIDTGKEPGKHVLNELTETHLQFENKNIQILFFENNGKTDNAPTPAGYTLPKNSTIVKSSGKEYYKHIKLKSAFFTETLPVVVLCNSKGEILYFQSGYKVGMANQILGIIK